MENNLSLNIFLLKYIIQLNLKRKNNFLKVFFNINKMYKSINNLIKNQFD